MDDTIEFSQLLCLYVAAAVAILGLALGGYFKTPSRRSPQPWRDGEPEPWPKRRQLTPLIPPESEPDTEASGQASQPSPPIRRPGSTPTRLRSKLIQRSLRRKGEATPVQVCSMDVDAQPFDTTVVDRSNGGLALCLPEPVSVGTILRVRSTQYEDFGPWVEVEVRHCRANNNQWLAGCKFKEKLPLNVLLLFG